MTAMMSTREVIEQRRARLMELAALLRQVPEGAVTFSALDDEGKRELLHNGVPTGHRISNQLYLAVTNKTHPTQPMVSITDDKMYDLTPDILEREFPSIYQFVEDCVLYLMLWCEVPADKVVLTVQRTDKDTLQYTFTERRDGTEDKGNQR